MNALVFVGFCDGVSVSVFVCLACVPCSVFPAFQFRVFCFSVLRVCVLSFSSFLCFWKFLVSVFEFLYSVSLCFCGFVFVGFSALWVLRFSAPVYACACACVCLCLVAPVKGFKLYPLRCSAPLYACACACVCLCLWLEQTGSNSIHQAMVAIIFVALPQESAHVAVQDSA